MNNLTIQCPSAMEENDDALVFGVVEGTAERPQVAYLTTPQPLTQEIRDLCSPATPAEVLRIATHCVRYRCIHFEHENCTLAQRVIQILPAAVEQIPACKLRPVCRWWLQEGKSACFRCPQIVRTPSFVTDVHRKVAGSQSVTEEVSPPHPRYP